MWPDHGLLGMLSLSVSGECLCPLSMKKIEKQKCHRHQATYLLKVKQQISENQQRRKSHHGNESPVRSRKRDQMLTGKMEPVGYCKKTKPSERKELVKTDGTMEAREDCQAAWFVQQQD